MKSLRKKKASLAQKIGNWKREYDGFGEQGQRIGHHLKDKWKYIAVKFTKMLKKEVTSKYHMGIIQLFLLILLASLCGNEPNNKWDV